MPGRRAAKTAAPRPGRRPPEATGVHRSCAALAALVAALAGCASSGTIPSYTYYTGAAHALRVGVAAETTGQRVGHAPNLPDGTLADPDRRQRLSGTRLLAELDTAGGWRTGLAFDRRSIVTRRDSFEIDGLALDLARPLGRPRDGHGSGWRLFGRISAHGADELEKNSWTELDGGRLENARVRSPRDVQAGIGIGRGFSLLRRWRFDVSFAAGAASVSHGALVARARDADGCRYSFASGGGGATLGLDAPCGDLQSLERTWPDEGGLDARYGLAPSRDLDWRGLWFEPGLALVRESRMTRVALGWRYRRWFRDGFDERIESRGLRARRSAQVLSLDLARRLGPRVELTAALAWRVAPYLDEVPMLYNRFTSERERRPLTTLTLGLRVGFGGRRFD